VLRQDDRVPTLRILSVDARPLGRDRAALADLINNAEADVVCVHNAPHLGRWRNKVGSLARRTGRVVVTAGGRRGGANVVFATLAVDSRVTDVQRFTGTGGTSPAGVALAELRADGVDLVVASATLQGDAGQRVAQAGELHGAVDRFAPGRPPAIMSVLGADRPGTAAYQALADRRVAVSTRLFVDERFDVVEAKEVGGPPPATGVLAVVDF
jgi:hypothetical protein